MTNDLQQAMKRLKIGLKKARPERVQDTNDLIESHRELDNYLKGENSTIAILECVLEEMEDRQPVKTELLRRLSDRATLYKTDLSISCHKIIDIVSDIEANRKRLKDSQDANRSLTKENEDLRNALVAQAVVNSGGTPKPPMKSTGWDLSGDVTLHMDETIFKQVKIDFD